MNKPVEKIETMYMRLGNGQWVSVTGSRKYITKCAEKLDILNVTSWQLCSLDELLKMFNLKAADICPLC